MVQTAGSQTDRRRAFLCVVVSTARSAKLNETVCCSSYPCSCLRVLEFEHAMQYIAHYVARYGSRTGCNNVGMKPTSMSLVFLLGIGSRFG